MSSNRLSSLTIVVVDDHNDFRRYLGLFLGHLGANVTLAANAIEGLEAVKTYRPNLVLSNISMPGRDGFGLLNDIRTLGPDEGGRAPVIAMTALGRWQKNPSSQRMIWNMNLTSSFALFG
jgi:CheY-like chemotaxis protein